MDIFEKDLERKRQFRQAAETFGTVRLAKILGNGNPHNLPHYLRIALTEEPTIIPLNSKVSSAAAGAIDPDGGRYRIYWDSGDSWNEPGGIKPLS